MGIQNASPGNGVSNSDLSGASVSIDQEVPGQVHEVRKFCCECELGGRYVIVSNYGKLVIGDEGH